MPGSVLDLIAGGERMLAEAASIEELREVADMAEAARVYAEQARLGTSAINYATSIKVRAEIRLANAVDAGQANGTIAVKGRPGEEMSGVRTFTELGLNRKRVEEARALRDGYTEDEIAALVAERSDADVELGRAKLLHVARLNRRLATKATAIDAIAERNAAPLEGLGPFGLILADPPWQYEHASPSRAIEANHYPTMTLEDIRALDVPADDDAILFCWAPAPKLTEALSVVDAWGFNYRTNLVWVKDKIGMGYYARSQHELLLIGVRGDIKPPEIEDRPSSVIDSRRGPHSEKPAFVYDLIEKMYPLAERCELFARAPRAGWYSWGNQS